MKTITKIDAAVAEPAVAKKRVAAYARVSSGKDAMLHSLSAQVNFYSRFIRQNADWEYCGVYADEAYTGTKNERPEFQRLLANCRAGRLDIVLTKSISRFARNTVTTLETIRELKRLGIDVWFEREKIHTLSEDGEFLITLLSSFAQEESLSTSENQKWRVRKNFKEGKPTSARITGYQLIGDTFVVIPEEAETVRSIFSLYLSGLGKTAIAKKLNARGIPAKNGGLWHESVIGNILKNEKYVGDMRLQKTFIADHISKRQVKNEGQLPQYYVRDAHEAIIDRDTFERVQAEIQRRAEKHAPNQPHKNAYLFTGKIVCGKCGKHYKRKTTASKAVWICSTFNQLGKAYCASQQIPEQVLLDLVDGEPFTQLRIPKANTVVIIRPDGAEITKHWHTSRRDSWTEEKRMDASKKAKERYGTWQKEK
ncbi:Recombinase family protein [Ruminococcaceae bacterium BL-6]|nr:Recombinase family protein [Ruminococcaceae bacterium BL-6]